MEFASVFGQSSGGSFGSFGASSLAAFGTTMSGLEQLLVLLSEDLSHRVLILIRSLIWEHFGLILLRQVLLEA